MVKQGEGTENLMAPFAKEKAYGAFMDMDGTSVRLDARECEAVRATLRLIEGGKSQDRVTKAIHSFLRAR